jgi:hypothetical protein
VVSFRCCWPMGRAAVFVLMSRAVRIYGVSWWYFRSYADKAADFCNCDLRRCDSTHHTESPIVASLDASVTWAHAHAVDPESVSAWQQINARDKLIPLTIDKIGKTVQSHTPTLFADPGDAIIRDYAERFGTQQVLIMSVPDGEPSAVRWLALYRENPNMLDTDNERALCDVVMPHLMEALSINRLATRDEPDRAPTTRAYRCRYWQRLALETRPTGLVVWCDIQAPSSVRLDCRPKGRSPTLIIGELNSQSRFIDSNACSYLRRLPIASN